MAQQQALAYLQQAKDYARKHIKVENLAFAVIPNL